MNRSRVAQWMTPQPTVIDNDMTLQAAYRLMCTLGVRHLPVVDSASGRLLTIVSRTWIQRYQLYTMTRYAESQLPHVIQQATTFRTVSLPPLVCVSPDALLQSAARRLSRHPIGAVAVIDEDQLTGILTRSDLSRYYESHRAQQTAQ